MAESLGRGRGPCALQAAIAQCHDTARSVADTDWERIVVLYEALGRVAPSPVVQLNRAVAVSMTEGPGPALEIVDGLVARGSLPLTAGVAGVRGELLLRLGRLDDARSELAVAAHKATNEREQAVYERKLRAAR